MMDSSLIQMKLGVGVGVKYVRARGNSAAVLAQDANPVNFVTRTPCYSWPQNYLGQGK